MTINIEEALKEEIESKPPVCSDHGSDCMDVKSPLICFIGNIDLPTADGLCPLIHNDSR